MKKHIACGLFLLLGITLALCIGGCNKSGKGTGADEDAIRTAIDAELEPLNDPKPDNLSVFVDDVKNEDLEALRRDYGIDIKKLLSHAFREFDYEIQSVSIDGNEAKVTLNVTTLDGEQAVAEASKLAQSQDNASKIANVYRSSDANAKKDLVNYTLGLLYQALDSTNDLTTSQVELSLSKQGKEWKIDSDGLDEFLETALAGLDLKSL